MSNDPNESMTKYGTALAGVFKLNFESKVLGTYFSYHKPIVDLYWHWIIPGNTFQRVEHVNFMTATAGSDVIQSGRPIFDDFFQHLWPYIGSNTAKVVFQIVKRLWVIRIDQ
ncbi:hypothetical protein TNCV_3518071 [Trichonephila clavipes]|nr:hypothetical protein TNCV_3518071 [Trichonephila clavipes]